MALAERTSGVPHPLMVGVGVVAGWFIPGLGHALAGHLLRGALLFVLIGGLFLAGMMMGDFETVSRALHPYAYWAEIGFGSATLFLQFLNPAHALVLPHGQAVHQYQAVPLFVDPGVLFCSVAGLLNLLVLFDLIERRLGGPFAREPK